jgi:hypothetical protein
VYLLNNSPLQFLDTFAPPTETDLPHIYAKNVSWKSIREEVTPYVNQVLERMNSLIDEAPSAKKKYRHIDVKVQDLSTGQDTANGLWHLDSSLNPVAEYDNLLFVTGQCALTEFVVNPFEVEHAESAGLFHRSITTQKELKIERVPSCTIVRYNGSHVHRGPKATGVERRLLIRMVATDVILPRKLNHRQGRFSQ